MTVIIIIIIKYQDKINQIKSKYYAMKFRMEIILLEFCNKVYSYVQMRNLNV